MRLQGARVCYFSSVQCTDAGLQETGDHASTDHMPASSLFALENIIQQRVEQHSQESGDSLLQELKASQKRKPARLNPHNG